MSVLVPQPQPSPRSARPHTMQYEHDFRPRPNGRSAAATSSTPSPRSTPAQPSVFASTPTWSGSQSWSGSAPLQQQWAQTYPSPSQSQSRPRPRSHSPRQSRPVHDTEFVSGSMSMSPLSRSPYAQPVRSASAAAPFAYTNHQSKSPHHQELHHQHRSPTMITLIDPTHPYWRDSIGDFDYTQQYVKGSPYLISPAGKSGTGRSASPQKQPPAVSPMRQTAASSPSARVSNSSSTKKKPKTPENTATSPLSRKRVSGRNGQSLNIVINGEFDGDEDEGEYMSPVQAVHQHRMELFHLQTKADSQVRDLSRQLEKSQQKYTQQVEDAGSTASENRRLKRELMELQAQIQEWEKKFAESTR
jgi:hypothetical protein